MKLIAAMSGGVDSAVAASRAVADGHQIVGVHLALASNPQKYRSGARGCCTIEDSHDARRAADVIGIPFYIWDMAEEFHDGVVENFLSEYAAGRTPNPCLRCNEKIKFAAVLDRAKAMGFDGVVTGHYAIMRETNGERTLHRAIDNSKDQSYVLAVLNREQLQGAYFPLGDTEKVDIRKEAERKGLAVANKPDSHDICFVPSGDNAGWLRDRLGSEIGPIVDSDGNVIGQHKGAYTYTIGQRKGLGLTIPAADGNPRFVLKIEPKTNTVVVGAREDLAVNRIVGEKPVWCGSNPGTDWQSGFVQARAHGAALECKYREINNGVEIQLAAPLLGLATGQAAVIYDGDRVVGSSTICETE
ncbi:MAG: tRNA 2-thiouridine(34) synthase MnmA [Candidatus Nanopelagicaceae bacterium]